MMIAGVPEPTSGALLLFAMCAVAATVCPRKNAQAPEEFRRAGRGGNVDPIQFGAGSVDVVY